MQDILSEDIRIDERYNLGGVSSILLLDMDAFYGFEFEEDKLYDEVLVDRIFRTAPFLELEVVSESKFNETYSNVIYKQELSSFVRIVNSDATCWLENAKTIRFLVIFKNMQERYFSFGEDGGVQLFYSLQTGKVGETNGMSISLEKTSVLPHFEVKESAIREISSVFIPQFDHAYCLGWEYIPQFDEFYCVDSVYQPQFDSFKCITQ